MTESDRAFTAGIIDFNPKRMTPDQAKFLGIPPDLSGHLADERQYPLNIAGLFPDNIAWFNTEQPWFFRTVFASPELTHKLTLSDTFILSGSGMSAQRFQENPEEYYSPEDIEYLNQAETLTRNQLGKGKYILGICYGGQLGMHAIGGRIGRLPDNVTEAGWLNHSLTEAGKKDEIFGYLPETFYAPHFHNDYVAKLPEVGTIVHTDSGDIKVTRAEILAVRHGYLDRKGPKDQETDYIMASVVEFDNGAKYYQIQPHPEMATPEKANFLVRMNSWLGKDEEMGKDYLDQATNIPEDADFGVSRVITRFTTAAKVRMEQVRGEQFAGVKLVTEINKYLIK